MTVNQHWPWKRQPKHPATADTIMKLRPFIFATVLSLGALTAYSFFSNDNGPVRTNASTITPVEGLSQRTLEELSDADAPLPSPVNTATIHPTASLPQVAATADTSPPPPGTPTDATQDVHIQMYNQQPFGKELDAFFPFERIYVAITFPRLTAGKHALTAQWIDPTGKTVNSSAHTVLLEQPTQNKRIYFWLELIETGTFTQMFTGKEYSGDVYGTWRVDVYLDYNMIGSRAFTVHE